MANAKTPAAKPEKSAAKPAKAAAAKPAAKPAAPKAAARSSSKPAHTPFVTNNGKELVTYGTGRRKDAVARVWVKLGSGKITVNGREVSQYFARPVLRMIINQPFAALNRIGNFDVMCTVVGGGLSGQAGAVRHGISRALDEFDQTFHTSLRRGSFLTRDPRVVERKKYGHKKARRSFQFSKR